MRVTSFSSTWMRGTSPPATMSDQDSPSSSSMPMVSSDPPDSADGRVARYSAYTRRAAARMPRDMAETEIVARDTTRTSRLARKGSEMDLPVNWAS